MSAAVIIIINAATVGPNNCDMGNQSAPRPASDVAVTNRSVAEINHTPRKVHLSFCQNVSDDASLMADSRVFRYMIQP